MQRLLAITWTAKPTFVDRQHRLNGVAVRPIRHRQWRRSPGNRRYLQVTTTTVRESLGWSHLLLQSGNLRHTAGYPFGSLHWTRTTTIVLSRIMNR